MKRILHFALGYSIFSIPKEHAKEVLNFSNCQNIPILIMKFKDNVLILHINTRNEKRFSEFLESNFGSAFFVSRCGLPQIVTKYRHRAGLMLGILLFIVSVYVSPMFIWQVNISGLEQLSHDSVSNLLADAGIKIGAFSPTLKREEINNKILKKSGNISWISVNIQGSSANIEIIERDINSTPYLSSDGANIVAARDGQIIDADIIKGRRIVKNGEVVSEGALLVSGIYESTKTGTHITHAKANVYAKVQDELYTEISLKNSKKIYGEEAIAEMSIKIFGKSINILKNYSKTNKKCDTIKKENKIPIAGLDRLPIIFETVYELPYSYEPITLTANEALDMARQEIDAKIEKANYTELISTEECFTVENTVLFYSCRVEAIQNIASVSEFNID